MTDEQVCAIYDLVKWAPTSMDQQPLRVVTARSEEARQLLFPHLPQAEDAMADDGVRHYNAQLNGARPVAYFIGGVRAAGLRNRGPTRTTWLDA